MISNEYEYDTKRRNVRLNNDIDAIRNEQGNAIVIE